MASRVPVNLTVDEYLEAEKTALVRREYVAGQIYAMAGASDAHNTIAGNFFAALRSKLRGGPCRVYVSDMKVRVEAVNALYYPDVVVTCDPEDNGEYVKTRPCLIVEVTSPSTTVTDHREKLLAYRKLASLREYVMATQHEMKVEIYRLDPRGNWWLEPYSPDDSFKLESVDMEVAVKDLYEDVILRPWPHDWPEIPTNPE
jgi:Uma2 family endonuclease